MEVELRLKVKGVTIELSPDEAKELVKELAKLTGQDVDRSIVWPYPIYIHERPWSVPYWHTANTKYEWVDTVTSNTGTFSIQAKAG